MEYHNFEDVKFVVQACINSKRKGIPLQKLDEEFAHFYGTSIPYAYFGFPNLKSYLVTLPDVYMEGESAIFYSGKSSHITKLVNSVKYDCVSLKQDTSLFYDTNNNNTSKVSVEEFSKFEEMFPLFYNHQAMGDDFFLDIAHRNFGYYIPPNGPYECGLCACNQTIDDLIEKINNSKYLAPRVAVMIGIADLLSGRNIKNIVKDLRALISILKNKKVDITLFTVIKPASKYLTNHQKRRIRIYNNNILKYRNDPILKCKVVDMYAMFKKAQFKPYRDCLSKNDAYQVLTKSGRKIFLNIVRKYLVQNL